MTPILRFTVPGVPATKGSTKSFIVHRKRDGKPIAVTTNDNPRAKGWQQLIAERAAAALAEARLQPFAEGPVILDVWFYFPRPQKFLTTKYADVDVPHTTRPDVDKAARAAIDALSRVVWRDDSQVIDAYVHKRYCAAGEVPRAEIAVCAVQWNLPRPIVHRETPRLFGEEALYGTR